MAAPVVSLRFATAALMLLALMIPGVGQSAGDAREAVVMLSTRPDAPPGTPRVCGAGIVLARLTDRTLILTALHIVREDGASNDTPLQAEFWGRRGVQIPVAPLTGPGLRDLDLDYAVVSVPSEASPALARGALELLGTLQDGVGGLKEVREIGNAECRGWSDIALSRRASYADATQVQYDSVVKEGASGGALFTGDGALVGMVKETNGSRGVALPIGLLLDRLEPLHLGVQLRGRPEETHLEADAAERLGAERPLGVRLRPRDVTVQIIRFEDDGVVFDVKLPREAIPIRKTFDPPLPLDPWGPSSTFEGYKITPAQLDRSDPLLTLAFGDGSRLGPFQLPVREAVRADIAELLDAGSRDFYVEPCCGVDRLVVDSRIEPYWDGFEVAFSPGQVAYTIDCKTCATTRKAPFEGPLETGPAFPRSSSTRSVFIRARATTGQRSPWRERPVPTPGCLYPECNRATVALAPLTRGAPLQFASLNVSRSGMDGVRLEPAGRPPGAVNWTREVDWDGRGFLGGLTGGGWPKDDTIGIRYLDEMGRVAGPYIYRLPKAELLRASLQRPKADEALVCDSGLERRIFCGLESLLSLETIQGVELAFEPDHALKPLPLKPLGPEWLDNETRAKMRACGVFNCVDLYARYGASIAAPPGAADVYYRLRYRDGVVSPVIRKRIRPLSASN